MPLEVVEVVECRLVHDLVGPLLLGCERHCTGAELVQVVIAGPGLDGASIGDGVGEGRAREEGECGGDGGDLHLG